MLLTELDRALSLKLGDYVNNNDDGLIFSKAQRLKYLERATARLRRILPKIMLVNAPLFVKTPIYEEITFASEDNKEGKGILPSRKIIDISEIYAKIGANYYPTSRMNHDNFISIKRGKNSEYNPKITEDEIEIYYTTINDSIYLLPESSDQAYVGIEIVYIPDSEGIHLDLNTDIDINIPLDYIDLIITMSAIEGMEDIARQDKVQLYQADIANQLNILTQYSSYKEQKKGSEVNG